MDASQCTKNISLCINSNNLTLCSSVNNTCVENHGYCVFNEIIKPRCLCLPCFTGEHCEEEIVSKNLWSIFTPFDEVTSHKTSVQTIIGNLFGIFLLLNGILCLQTYLCKKIRITNLGIYLIMLSIVSILIGLMHLIFSSILFNIKKLPNPYLFAKIQCLIYPKFVYAPLVSMYNWFIASVAIERMLVECFRNCDLHDSRHRSVIVSTIIVVVCLLTTLPGVFTVRQNQPAGLISVQCINYTPLGYILDTSITNIHLFAFYLIYIIMNIVVLGHLLRHRWHFVDDDPLPTQVCLIMHKHKDFFIPYLIQALGQLPSILMNFIMSCSTANTVLVARVTLAYTVLQIVPFALTFYLYIYLAPVYWLEFWNSSPIGKCLTKVKKKIQTVSKRGAINNNNNVLETHF